MLQTASQTLLGVLHTINWQTETGLTREQVIIGNSNGITRCSKFKRNFKNTRKISSVKKN